MAKGFLPSKGTPEAEEIITLYPTADDTQIAEWVKKYGYSNRNTFTDAVYRTYGVKRGKPSVEEIIEKKRVISNVPLRLDTGSGFETAAIINDTHNPYQDEKALSLVENFLADLQPDYLIYNGDDNDFYQTSKFARDPSRIPQMQGDINNTKAMYRRHRSIMPNTRMLKNDGNHEDRLQKFLWTRAAEAASLDCLAVPELLALKEYEIEYAPYECGIMVNGVFLVIHSHIASVNSAYTAKRLFDKHGGCGICGHTHRGGSFYRRNRFGTYGWWENFCLCSLFPDWITNPDWQQGFSLVHFRGRRFWVEQIPIIGHDLMYGGKLYE